MNNVYRYYIYENEEVKGPFLLDELIKQNIKENTYVCYEGGDGWYLAGQFPEISEILFKPKSVTPQTAQENFEIKEQDGEIIANPKKESDIENYKEKEVEKIEFPECINHPGQEAFAICSVCLKDFCEECLEKVSGKFYCKNCKPKSSGFLSKLFKK